MNSILLASSIAVLAAAVSTSSLADGRGSRGIAGAAPQAQRSMRASDSHSSDERADRHDSRDHRRDREHPTRVRRGSWFDHGMQAVPTGAGAGEPGHGWRYFSDPAACRAVVISPQGEYYYSRGEGLGLVAVTQPNS